MNTKPLIFIPLIVAVASTFVACGGGSSGTSGSLSSEGTVSVLITDNLTLDYSEVWVQVQSITATDANGQTAVLYEDTTGQTHNLSQLVNIGALVDAKAIAAGTYTSFDITLANEINLVDNAGLTTNATFDQTGNPTFAMTVNGTLTVDPNQVTTLALDFDLQQFTYDAGANTVNPVVVQKDPALLNQTVVTNNGTVQSVTNGTQFVMTPATGGADLTVNLHANGTVTNAATGAVTADTAGLQVGMQVSVSGSYDAANMTITASGVHIENNTITVRHEVEGFVTAFDGSNLTLDIKEASFMPSTNTLDIANISNATFSTGDLSLITVGQELEIKGAWDGTSFTAVIVEIEGAPRNSHNNSYIDDYAEVEGLVSAISGNQFTLTVQEHEHVTGINIGDSVTLDGSTAWIKDGNVSCLVVGAQVEAKGAMTDSTSMLVNVIEIEDGCGQGNDDSSNDNNSDD